MSAKTGRLVAIDGANGLAVDLAARALARRNRRQRAAVSGWDASGIFGELEVAEADAGRPSARTLLLLYAADLAFRLRWEVKPALAEGRMVIAAPYVSTAFAFGRSAGIDAGTLAAMFAFAPPPDESEIIAAAGSRSLSDRNGFLEFACDQLLGVTTKAAKREAIADAGRTLRTLAAVQARSRRRLAR